MNKKNLIYLAIGLVVGGLSVYLLSDRTHLHDAHDSKAEVEQIHSEDEHDHDNDGEHDEHPSVVNLSDKVMKELGVEIKTATEGEIAEYIELTGEIVLNPNSLAHIVPRFVGVVKSVYKQIGDKVKKGDRIATIESNESLVSYDVKSSINGTILELHMTPGELIGGDAQHVAVVANLNSVWAELSLYQQDLSKVRKGQSVKISTSNNSSTFIGRIFYVSPTVDETTRTAIVRVKISNGKGDWKPGMFVSGSLLKSNRKVKVVVPNNAVQILNGKKVVFVNRGEGFTPQVVTLGVENNDLIEITAGLHSGDKYIAKGAYVFKSEILKESFGGGHHH